MDTGAPTETSLSRSPRRPSAVSVPGRRRCRGHAMIAVRTRRAALAVASLLVGQAAQAGILDSPPPSFGTVGGQVVFRMGPVLYQPGWTDTVITCTNVDDVQARVVLEIFDEGDHLVGNSPEATLPAPGGSVTYVTSADARRSDWV